MNKRVKVEFLQFHCLVLNPPNKLSHIGKFFFIVNTLQASRREKYIKGRDMHFAQGTVIDLSKGWAPDKCNFGDQQIAAASK